MDRDEFLSRMRRVSSEHDEVNVIISSTMEHYHCPTMASLADELDEASRVELLDACDAYVAAFREVR